VLAITFVDNLPSRFGFTPQLLFPTTPLVITTFIVLIITHRYQLRVAQVRIEAYFRGLNLNPFLAVIDPALIGIPLRFVALKIVKVIGIIGEKSVVIPGFPGLSPASKSLFQDRAAFVDIFRFFLGQGAVREHHMCDPGRNIAAQFSKTFIIDHDSAITIQQGTGTDIFR